MSFTATTIEPDFKKMLASMLEINTNILQMKQKLNDLSLQMTTHLLAPSLHYLTPTVGQEMVNLDSPQAPPSTDNQNSPETNANNKMNLYDQVVQQILNQFNQLDIENSSDAFQVLPSDTGYAKCIEAYETQFKYVMELIKQKKAQLEAEGDPKAGFNAAKYYLNEIIGLIHHFARCQQIRPIINPPHSSNLGQQGGQDGANP
jgi:hypothetical protein